MPEAPRVRIVARFVIATAPAGSAMRMPAQLVLAPRFTVVAVATRLSQTATSAEVGTTPPSQEVERLRLSVLFALKISAARLLRVGNIAPTRTAIDHPRRHNEDEGFPRDVRIVFIAIRNSGVVKGISRDCSSD